MVSHAMRDEGRYGCASSSNHVTFGVASPALCSTATATGSGTVCPSQSPSAASTPPRPPCLPTGWNGNGVPVHVEADTSSSSSSSRSAAPSRSQRVAHVRRRTHIPSPRSLKHDGRRGSAGVSRWEVAAVGVGVLLLYCLVKAKLFSYAVLCGCVLVLAITARIVIRASNHTLSQAHVPGSRRDAHNHRVGLTRSINLQGQACVYSRGRIPDQDFQSIVAGVLPSSCRGLPQGSIERFPAFLAGDSRYNVLPRCAICLESPRVSEKMRALPCCHTFHMACIDKWLLSRSTCPICSHNFYER